MHLRDQNILSDLKEKNIWSEHYSDFCFYLSNLNMNRKTQINKCIKKKKEKKKEFLGCFSSQNRLTQIIIINNVIEMKADHLITVLVIYKVAVLNNSFFSFLKIRLFTGGTICRQRNKIMLKAMLHRHKNKQKKIKGLILMDQKFLCSFYINPIRTYFFWNSFISLK